MNELKELCFVFLIGFICAFGMGLGFWSAIWLMM